jgi:protein SCO1
LKLKLEFGLLLILVLATTACMRTRRYALQGEVVAKDPESGFITVNHGDIPGFMMAMAMPYRVKDPAVLKDVEPGDKITATIVVRDRTNYWLEGVQVTDRSGRGKMRSAPGSKMVMPGEKAPDVALVNQDGKKVRLSDFAGKAVLVTFIYTRCPMPNFCPRLSSQFAHIHNELKKNKADYDATHLLTISFDPKYDTAPVLRKYGLSYLGGDESGFAGWDFVSATPEHLKEIADAFGAGYEDQGDLIVHNMSIVLIGRDGRVVKYWGTVWTWEELLQNLRHAAQTTATAQARSAGG